MDSFAFTGVTGLCEAWSDKHISEENRFGLDVCNMEPTIDLAGLLLVVLVHAGILALRLGISLQRA